jgi:hypothetical protein
MTDTKPRKLTPKQAHFARLVGAGSTQADAYREAYDSKPDTKPDSIHQAASRVARNPQVQARIEYVQGQKERGIVAASLSDRELVLTTLRTLAVLATPADSGKLRALELLGRTAGMFKDVVETRRPPATTSQLEDRLRAALDALPNEDDPLPEDAKLRLVK